MRLTATEIVATFKPPRRTVFDDAADETNTIRFRLSPNVSISLGARVKVPGDPMIGEAVEMVVRRLADDHTTPYERLLAAAIRGDAMLFAPEDAIEARWRLVEPILLRKETPLYAYTPGTWGPLEADQLLPDDAAWHSPGQVGP